MNKQHYIQPDVLPFKSPEFSIGSTKIGENHPCYVVAEIGINHDGSKDKALRMIEAAHQAGCQAVKFQRFRAEHMYTQKAGKLHTADGKISDILDIIRKTEIPDEWLPELQRESTSRGMAFFASVFDFGSVDVMANFGADAFKIASYELTHLPLIAYAAAKDKPFVFSCGGGTTQEVDEAVATTTASGQKNIVLMHCIAKYNAPLDSLNLQVIRTLRFSYPDILIGYSDHSSDPMIAPTAAVALGAKMIEKHITLDRHSPGPDHSFALEPKELKQMVQAIQQTEEKLGSNKSIQVDPQVLGTTARDTYENEQYVRDFAYRSIFSTQSIGEGEVFTTDNIEVLRPGEQPSGLHPRMFNTLLGRRATNKIPVGSAITWNDVLSS